MGIRQPDLAHKLAQAQAMVNRTEAGERRRDIIELCGRLSALEVGFLQLM